MVTTFCSLASTPVAVQLARKALGVFSITTGAVELVVKPDGKVTVMELPAPSDPDDDVVRPIVQVEAVLATNDEGAGVVKVTVERADAPASTTLESVIKNSVVNKTLLRVRNLLRTTVHRGVNWSRCQ
jgi:hypothetical protein